MYLEQSESRLLLTPAFFDIHLLSSVSSVAVLSTLSFSVPWIPSSKINKALSCIASRPVRSLSQLMNKTGHSGPVLPVAPHRRPIPLDSQQPCMSVDRRFPCNESSMKLRAMRFFYITSFAPSDGCCRLFDTLLERVKGIWNAAGPGGMPA
jgi:hypothetical protein